jgi:hypothetical protein
MGFDLSKLNVGLENELDASKTDLINKESRIISINI